jgi:hypothetical protein
MPVGLFNFAYNGFPPSPEKPYVPTVPAIVDNKPFFYL